MGLRIKRLEAVEPKDSVPKKIEPRTEGTIYLSQPFIFNNLLIYIAYSARNYITCALTHIRVIGKRRFSVPSVPRRTGAPA
jgi:hypothetical protein